MTLLENFSGPNGLRWLIACALCASTAACAGDEAPAGGTNFTPFPSTGSPDSGITTGDAGTPPSNGGSGSDGGTTGQPPSTTSDAGDVSTDVDGGGGGDGDAG